MVKAAWDGKALETVNIGIGNKEFTITGYGRIEAATEALGIYWIWLQNWKPGYHTRSRNPSDTMTLLTKLYGELTNGQQTITPNNGRGVMVLKPNL